MKNEVGLDSVLYYIVDVLFEHLSQSRHDGHSMHI